jgi:methionyl-tRNA formyltransferase
MLLEEGLDTGPILLQQTIEIGPEQTAADLFPVLARAGAPLVVETLAGLANGTIHPQPQNHESATFAPLLDREDGRIDFAARTAHEIYNRWRGFQPWPGAFTVLSGKKLIVHRMAIAKGSYAEALGFAEPGWILVENRRLLAACAANTWLEFLELQVEGKKRLTADEFLRGNPLPADARLG